MKEDVKNPQITAIPSGKNSISPTSSPTPAAKISEDKTPQTYDHASTKATGTEARLEVSVNKAPEIHVATGTDWVAFLGFIITAIVVFGTTQLTIKNSNSLIKSQEDLSREGFRENREIVKAELTANNRQAWINTLRSDIADYIAAISAIWDLHQIRDGRAQMLKAASTPENTLKELFEWSLAYHKAIQDSERLHAKIQLLLNPTEEKSIKLIVALDKALACAKNNEFPTKICREIVREAQPILKEEWERVKGLS